MSFICFKADKLDGLYFQTDERLISLSTLTNKYLKSRHYFIGMDFLHLYYKRADNLSSSHIFAKQTAPQLFASPHLLFFQTLFPQLECHQQAQ